jgi:hypothetical protein
LGAPSGQTTFVTASYVCLTAFTLISAYVVRGLRRALGGLVIAAYVAFAGVVFVIAY